MMNSMTFSEIYLSFFHNPRDVKTVPLNREGIWFYVYADGNNLYIDNARFRFPSSKLAAVRRLDKENFEKMYRLYLRRKRGEAVSAEAIMTTQNQVYWYGIFRDMEKRRKGDK